MGASVELAKGQPISKVVRKLGITDQTYYRWRKEYGGLRVDQAMGLVPGRLLRLDRPVGPEVSLRAGKKLIARGELVDHEGLLAVEITEVL